MKDDGKYLRLFGTLLLSVLGFIVSLLVVFLLIRLFFGLLSFIPWITYIYVIFIISVPAAVFITVFSIFFSRTLKHPSKPVRFISYTIFSVFLLTWAVIYIIDMIAFFSREKIGIEFYYSYDTLFLTINVVLIFFIGVLQALTTRKEADWLEKHRNDLIS